MDKRKRKRWIVLVALCALLACLIPYLLWANTVLTVSHVELDLLPGEGSFTIAQVSDLHNAEFGGGNGELLTILEEVEPDLIAITGDLIDSRRTDPAPALAFLEGAVELAPVCYVTGNHEFWTGRVEEIRELLCARGAVVLEGESAAVTAAGQTLRIGGIDDPNVGEDIWREQLEAVTAAQDGETFSILLTHRPERVEDYAGRGFDLVLAGHAHGGQWRLPGLINGLIAPNQGLFPRYAGGRYALDGDTTMIVSRGLARESTRIPRLFNRPELVVVDILPEGTA